MMKEKLRNFMVGRYGVDQFSKFLLYASIVLVVLAMLLRKPEFDMVAVALLGLCYYRMLSRNHAKRYQENVKYMHYFQIVTGKLKREKSHLKQRKTHHIYSCPSCKQKIRIPKGKGKIEVCCPKCSTMFTKKS